METLETFNKDFVFLFFFHSVEGDKQHLNHSVDGLFCTEQMVEIKKKKHERQKIERRARARERERER